MGQTKECFINIINNKEIKGVTLNIGNITQIDGL